jgi:hypothetical protein
MLTKNYLAIYAKSFNWAGFFLPKKTYQKCSALYDFCREADNIADDENKLEVKKDNFIKFKNNLNPILRFSMLSKMMLQQLHNIPYLQAKLLWNMKYHILLLFYKLNFYIFYLYKIPK